MKYEFYLKYFRENFNYRFGRPQVDVCSTCENLGIKIKSTQLNNNAKRVAVAELIVHKRRAKNFYSKLAEVKEVCQTDETSYAIVFDYMQNLPLPQTPVQEMFHLRKTWHFVFCIHSLGDGKSKFYTYHEGTAKKGPDEVCSFVLHYIDTFVPKTVSTLYVLSDACGGQNRNHTLIRLMSTLTIMKRFKTIKQYFPIRGPCFLPCDRNFATVKREIRKKDRVYLPQEYDIMIAEAKKKDDPYFVYSVQTKEIINFKTWWPQYYKKTTKAVNGTEKFAISQYRHLEYSMYEPGYVTCKQYIDGLVGQVFSLLKTKAVNVSLPTEKAYESHVPIKYKKLKDLDDLLPYILPEYHHFYQMLISRGGTEAEIDTDEE